MEEPCEKDLEVATRSLKATAHLITSKETESQSCIHKELGFVNTWNCSILEKQNSYVSLNISLLSQLLKTNVHSSIHPVIIVELLS